MLDKLEIQRCGFSELQKRISEISRVKRVKTNFYGHMELRNQEFQTVQTDQTIVFWYHDSNICRVFFYSVKESEIKELLKKVPQGAVVDIISKHKDEEEQWKALTGFSVLSVYGRFGRNIESAEQEQERFKKNPLDRFYREEYGCLAKKEQLNEIQHILQTHFDNAGDHLYSDDQMTELINNKRVWIQCEEGKITTIFVYKIEGKKFYSNTSFNDSTADVLYSIQKKVLLQAIEEYGIIYFYGWIRINNRQSLRKNHYPEFDAYDYVMIQGGEQCADK